MFFPLPSSVSPPIKVVFTPNVAEETRPGWYLKNLLEVKTALSLDGASINAPASSGM